MNLEGYVEGLINFDGEGTNVVANPVGTPTDNLETIQIGDVIYLVSGGGESIVPTPTNTDRGKYLGVKSGANELEYREVREVPDTSEVTNGNVLTKTVSGVGWYPPAKELPTYTSGDNGKVLGVINDNLAWVEQSGGGGGVSYSTEEQDTGLTWIDGNKVYQRTIYIESPTMSSRVNIDIALGIDKLISINGTVDRVISGLGSILYDINTYEDNNYRTYTVYDKYLDKLAYFISFSNSTCANLYITILYTKAS